MVEGGGPSQWDEVKPSARAQQRVAAAVKEQCRRGSTRAPLRHLHSFWHMLVAARVIGPLRVQIKLHCRVTNI